MPPVNVSFTESAVADLENIRDWYAQAGVPAVGRRLAEEIFGSIEMLADNPDMGRVVPEFGQTFLRELIHPPFRIVYRRESDRLRIVRVWRSERILKLTGEADH